MSKSSGAWGASGTRALAWVLCGAAALAGCVGLGEETEPAEAIGEESQEIRGANVGGANLSGANLGGANLGGANLGGANLASAGLNGSTASGSYAGLGCPISGTRNLGTDLTLSTTALDIHNLGSVANKLLRSGEDVHSRASSCVLLGIGSTALARLISQNSGATMYAAARQLPWGFASFPGGPVNLTAWEVVVWGSARYAVFIVAAPTTASFEGVTGYLKAVWRWAAPTSKSLKIGQVGGGKTVRPTRA